MKVLVTGGAGFIGSHVGAALTARGHHVVVLDDFSTGLRSNIDDPELEPSRAVDVVDGSILDPDALGRAIEGVGAIVHLAARPSVPRSIDDPLATHEANTVGTLRVLEAARAGGVEHVVIASSSSVYGANPALPKREDMATLPLSPYAASKLATEQYALAWQHSYGLGVLAFRFFNVFGPRQQPGSAYAAVIPAFVDAAVRGGTLIVHGDGSQTRDFTYVGTVAGVIVDAVERRVTCPTPVNLAFGTRVSLAELVGRIEAQLGHAVAVTHIASRPGDVAHSQADTALLQQLFPDADPILLDDGLAATLEWMRARPIAPPLGRDT